MINITGKTFAIDFDGTLFTNGAWPNIGEPITKMINLCKELKAAGNYLILWTCRTDEPLEHAIAVCKRYGIEFDAINENLKSHSDYFKTDSRKIFADYYIDDKALNPFNDNDFNFL